MRFRSVEEATARVLADFGIGALTAGAGVVWSREELEALHEAFSRTSGTDRSALRGVEVHRERSNGTIAHPMCVGYFDWGVDLVGEKAVCHAVLSLDDRVFAGESAPRGAAWRGSLGCILHEVGHAFETGTLRDAVHAYNRSLEAYRSAALALEKTDTTRRSSGLAKVERLRVDLEARMETCRKARAADGSSMRLAEFQAYVEAKRIEPPTAYAATGTSDFFAESYMLFRVDPGALRAASPLLHDYFARITGESREMSQPSTA